MSDAAEQARYGDDVGTSLNFGAWRQAWDQDAIYARMTVTGVAGICAAEMLETGSPLENVRAAESLSEINEATGGALTELCRDKLVVRLREMAAVCTKAADDMETIDA